MQTHGSGSWSCSPAEERTLCVTARACLIPACCPQRFTALSWVSHHFRRTLIRKRPWEPNCCSTGCVERFIALTFLVKLVLTETWERAKPHLSSHEMTDLYWWAAVPIIGCTRFHYIAIFMARFHAAGERFCMNDSCGCSKIYFVIRHGKKKKYSWLILFLDPNKGTITNSTAQSNDMWKFWLYWNQKSRCRCNWSSQA